MRAADDEDDDDDDKDDKDEARWLLMEHPRANSNHDDSYCRQVFIESNASGCGNTDSHLVAFCPYFIDDTLSSLFGPGRVPKAYNGCSSCCWCCYRFSKNA